jgi:adenylate kinase
LFILTPNSGVQGLLEVCKTRPTDPIDYLAAFLFKNNPQLN